MPALQRWWPEPRQGVSAVRIVLHDHVPDDGREYVAAAAGDSPFAAGTALPPGAPLESPTPAWVHPHLAPEPQWLLDLDIPLVAETADAVVIDKPHGLPSTPNGGLLRATAQSLLRVRRNEPNLVAVHRLDRWTGGLLVLSRRLETRRFLHMQFQRHQVAKTYHAVAADLPWLPVGTPRTVKLRMVKIKDDPQDRVVNSPAVPKSAMTTTVVEKLPELPGVPEVPEVRGEHATQRTQSTQGTEGYRLYRLRPTTGHTHQLRVVMNHLGAPIVADNTYPVYRPMEADERPDVPLQLRAVELSMRLDVASETVHHLDISRLPRRYS